MFWGLRISLKFKLKQKQAVITLLSRQDLLASSFSFWFEWRKSWSKLHVWSLFNLCKVICSIVRSLSDLTIVATDEERFTSKTADLLCDLHVQQQHYQSGCTVCKRQQSQWKNNRISCSSPKIHSSQEKQSILSVPKEWYWQLIYSAILYSCFGFSLSYNSDLYITIWGNSTSCKQRPAQNKAGNCHLQQP